MREDRGERPRAACKDQEFLRVGELAKRTGVSVRTLHYYDEIGLLKPAVGGGGGHRHYGKHEIDRLLRIRSLSALGMSLSEVKGCLDDESFSSLRVVGLHLERVTGEIEIAHRLRDKLENIARSLRASEEASVAEFLQAIAMTTMFEKYYTKEQLTELEARRDRIGEDGMKKAEQDWNELFDEFRQAMARGDDPASDSVQA